MRSFKVKTRMDEIDETPYLWEARGTGWASAQFDCFVYLIL